MYGTLSLVLSDCQVFCSYLPCHCEPWLGLHLFVTGSVIGQYGLTVQYLRACVFSTVLCRLCHRPLCLPYNTFKTGDLTTKILEYAKLCDEKIKNVICDHFK